MMRAAVVAAMGAVLLAGCDPDMGGGGGGGDVVFSEGFVFIRADAANADQLWIADRRDFNAASKLTSAGASNPSLKRDGREIVFVEGTGATSAVKTVATTVGAPVRTVFVPPTGSSLRNFRHPVFSPDGSFIVFTYDKGTAFSGLARVNPDGTGFAFLAPSADVGSSATSWASPSFGATGTEVFAAAGTLGSYRRVERVTVATGSGTVVLTSLGNEAQNITDRVVVSPDGTKLAFSGRLSTGVSRIFVNTLGSPAVTRLTDHPGEQTTATDTYPVWMSAAQVAFSASVAGGDAIYVVSATATAPSAGSLTVPSAREPGYGRRAASTAVAQR